MFATAQRVLARWAGGHVAVGEPGREQFLELRGITDADKARAALEELLAGRPGQRETVAVTGHVLSDAQAPMAAYRPGDRLGGQTVRSLAITMGPEGETIVTPELVDPVAIWEEQFARRVEKLNAGVTSEHASPFPAGAEKSKLTDSTPPTFTWEWAGRDYSQPYDPTPPQLTDGALAYWPLRSNLTDATGNGNDLTWVGGSSPAYYTFDDPFYGPGLYGMGLNFSSPLTLSSSSWSFEAKIQFSDTWGGILGTPLVAEGTDYTGAGLFARTILSSNMQIAGGDTFWETAGNRPQLTHCTITHSPGSTKIYTGTTLVKEDATGAGATGNAVTVGGGVSGWITDAAVYDFELTPEQIANHQ